MSKRPGDYSRVDRLLMDSIRETLEALGYDPDLAANVSGPIWNLAMDAVNAEAQSPATRGWEAQ